MAVTFDNFKYSAMAATVFGCGIYYLYRRMKEVSDMCQSRAFVNTGYAVRFWVLGRTMSVWCCIGEL